MKQIRDVRVRVYLILLIALLVRLIGIVTRPIWYDEAFSILFSEKGLGQMLYGTLAPTGAGSADIHPLGYYTLLWGWMKLLGSRCSPRGCYPSSPGLGRFIWSTKSQWNYSI